MFSFSSCVLLDYRSARLQEMGVPAGGHWDELHRCVRHRTYDARISNLHLQYPPGSPCLRDRGRGPAAVARRTGGACRLLVDPLLDVSEEALSSHISGGDLRHQKFSGDEPSVFVTASS